MNTMETTQTTPEQYPNRLRYFREKRGYSVRKIAEFLGVRISSVYNAELYGRSLGYDSWDRLADLFSVDPRILRGKKPLEEN